MDSCNSYDIAPGEERTVVDVITGFSTEPGSEGEPVYQQRYLNRPANTRFHEPLDLSGEDSSVDAVPMRYNSNNRPDHQKYHGERERLKTFENNWRPEYNVTKEDLAREGFIYKGPGDLVLCVFCLKSIRRWDAGDDVSGEHKRLYPNCPWVRGKIQYNIPISSTDSMHRNMRVSSRGQPKISDMKTREARINTFQSWTATGNVRVEELVKDGFFYDSPQDFVTCFHCGIRIPGWNVDRDFVVKHIQNSPDCPVANPVRQNGPGLDHSLDSNPRIGNGTEEAELLQERTSTDDDMQSPAVLAILDSFGDDYSVEDIMKAVQALRVSKGDGDLSSKEILEQLDQDLDS